MIKEGFGFRPLCTIRGAHPPKDNPKNNVWLFLTGGGGLGSNGVVVHKIMLIILNYKCTLCEHLFFFPNVFYKWDIR